MDFVHPVQAVIPGVPGRILAVLAETTQELNLRTIARLARVSQAQVSRVLPSLVSLGLVERRQAPPSALFRLVPEHVAAGPILALARTRDRMIEAMRHIVQRLPVQPASVIIFGSFARGESEVGSDIDTVLVRPHDVDDSDEAWARTVRQWLEEVSAVSGNRVEVLELAEAEVATRLASNSTLWDEVQRDGILISGMILESFRPTTHG